MRGMRTWTANVAGWLAFGLLACLGVAPAARAGDAPPTEVVVLSTLHGMHEQVPAYGYAELARIVATLAPDALCVEVSPDKFARRAPEAVKREYPLALYPLIDDRHYRVYPLEPGDRAASALVAPYLAANQAFAKERPEASQAFKAYVDGLFAALRAYWSSPARVNDAVTDDLMRAKHGLQQALVGEGERRGWDGWNRHFLQVVEQAVREHPGQRVVVTVGAEHGYWLRDHLKGRPGIRLLDTATLLQLPAGDGADAP